MNRLKSLSWQLDKYVGFLVLWLDPIELRLGRLGLGASQVRVANVFLALNRDFGNSSFLNPYYLKWQIFNQYFKVLSHHADDSIFYGRLTYLQNNTAAKDLWGHRPASMISIRLHFFQLHSFVKCFFESSLDTTRTSKHHYFRCTLQD